MGPSTKHDINLLAGLQPADVDPYHFMQSRRNLEFEPDRLDCSMALFCDEWAAYKMGYVVFWLTLCWQQFGTWVPVSKTEIIDIASEQSSKEFAADPDRIIELIEAGLEYLATLGYIGQSYESAIIITDHLLDFLRVNWPSEDEE
jgi:hypothetical protein